MADIHPRRNKKGELISFGIRVYHGYDRFGNRIKPSCTTFKANPEWSEKKNRTECEKFANRFEEQCKMGFNLTHGITFSEYADYVIRLKESTGVKHTTILSYRGLLKRINPGIGHLKITEIHPQQLNDLYRQLGKDGLRREGGKAVAKKDLREIQNQMGITFADFAKNAKISVNTLAKAVHGEVVAERIANSISGEMGVKTETLFNIEKNKNRCQIKLFWSIIVSYPLYSIRRKRKCWCSTILLNVPLRRASSKKKQTILKPRTY